MGRAGTERAAGARCAVRLHRCAAGQFPVPLADRTADHGLRALRLSYAGELGWELHIPRDSALAVYDALRAAGERHGIADYGSFAMNALRMEKAFKGAGELTNEVTLAEADVLRFARTDKAYLGRDKTLNTDLPWVTDQTVSGKRFTLVDISPGV